MTITIQERVRRLEIALTIYLVISCLCITIGGLATNIQDQIVIYGMGMWTIIIAVHFGIKKTLWEIQQRKEWI